MGAVGRPGRPARTGPGVKRGGGDLVQAGAVDVDDEQLEDGVHPLEQVVLRAVEGDLPTVGGQGRPLALGGGGRDGHGLLRPREEHCGLVAAVGVAQVEHDGRRPPRAGPGAGGAAGGRGERNGGVGDARATGREVRRGQQAADPEVEHRRERRGRPLRGAGVRLDQVGRAARAAGGDDHAGQQEQDDRQGAEGERQAPPVPAAPQGPAAGQHLAEELVGRVGRDERVARVAGAVLRRHRWSPARSRPAGAPCPA